MYYPKWLFKPVEPQPMPLGMHCKPWYKDRLPSKYFAKSKDRSKFPTSLNTQNWVFVKEGQDDFRRGCPPCTEAIIRRPKEGLLPVIYRTSPGPAPKSCRKKPPKYSTLYSKLSSAQQARKAFVEEMEASVKPHPLACCPNLEEQLPANVLKEVLEVLDPDKQLEDAWAYLQDGKKRGNKSQGVLKSRSVRASLYLPKLTPVPNPDDWLKEMFAVEDLVAPPAVPKNIDKAVKDFCEWVDSFGIDDIDEEFILNQFEPEFPDIPKLGQPEIKDMIQLPSEVMFADGKTKPEPRLPLPNPDLAKTLYDQQFRHKEKPVKMRYGAWYLKPKLWKKLREDEPLLDPEAPYDTEDGIFRRVEKGPDILEELYGTIAFKDFILSKGYSMPAIIERLFKRKGWSYDTMKIPAVLLRRHSILAGSSQKN